MSSFVDVTAFQYLNDEKQAVLRELLSSSSIPKQYRWFRISTEVLSPTVPFSVHQELYRLNYAGCEDYESPVWFPHQYTATSGDEKMTVCKEFPLHCRDTNIQRLMKKKGFKTYSEFYDWSVGMDTCEDYWDTCINELGVQFRSPYSKVFDYSATPPDGSVDPLYGVKSVKYLTGAKFNIADSCFPREFMSAEPGSDIPPAVTFASDADSTLQHYTHKELFDFSSQIALSLARYQLPKGSAIGICMPMTPESIAIYLGIIKAGYAVVSIADSFSAIEIATRMKLAKAKVIVTQDVIGRGEKILPLYTRVLEAQPDNVIVIPYSQARVINASVTLREPSTGSDDEIGDVNLYDILPDRTSPEVQNYVSVTCCSDDICNILFSSGTTGEPKAIPWYHTTPIKSAIDGFIHQDVQRGDVCCWPTNLGWMMGPWILFQLMNKGTIAIFNGVSTTFGFMQFVQDAKVNMLGVVPSIVKAWKTITEKQTSLLKEKYRKDLETYNAKVQACKDSDEAGKLEAPVKAVDYYWPFDWSRVTRYSSTGEASDFDTMLWLMSRVGSIPGCKGSGVAPVMEYCGGTEIAGSFLSSTMVQPNIPAMFSTPVCGSRVGILDSSGELAYSDKTINARRLASKIQDLVGVESNNSDKTEITGEMALIPPSLGLSTHLLNRVHHDVYYTDMPTAPDGRLLRRHGDEIQNLPGSYYRALGRCDDTMNIGGIKVSSVEIERVCNIASPTIISETAAIAITPKNGGPSQLVIVVLTKPMTSGIVIDSNTTGATLQEQELAFKNKVKGICQTAIKTKLNPLFHVFDIVITSELPRTASNKIMRRVLRDNYVSNRDGKR